MSDDAHPLIDNPYRASSMPVYAGDVNVTDLMARAWDRGFAAAADFDRLRDERDTIRADLFAMALEAGETRRVAGVLADALRELHAEVTRFQPGESAGVRLQSRGPSFAAAEALAVFDTLTEEKT